MKIKIIAVLLMSLFMVESIRAEIIEPKEDALVQIRYNKKVNIDTIGGKSFREDPMILRIGKTASMFYPEKLMFVDSLDYCDSSAASKLISLQDIIKDGGMAITKVKGWESEYLFRNIHDDQTMVCQHFATYHLGYNEKTELPQWTVHTDSTTQILGYECIYATASYRGRDWEAWFTPELPFKEGPWKLAGLPGVVLKAQDSRGQYEFEASSIMTGDIPQVGIFIYERRHLDMMKDRMAYLKAIYHLVLKAKFMNEVSIHTDFKPLKTDRIPLYDLMETDYPHN
ncbi:MAG: GLPGLI family protein [Muribaculaceae bacterium]|nr:GLPGLI family protein [Muribaculaceae bacterium]